MKIKSLKTKDVYSDEKLLKTLIRLTLPDLYQSWMRTQVENKKDGIITLGYLNNKLVGWSLQIDSAEDSKHVLIGVFISNNHRRQGFGELLLKRAKGIAGKRNKQLICCSWNFSSNRFYNKYGITEWPWPKFSSAA